ncbi:hypothetical protein Hanom_Chr07g00597771 [Helianthus anomalus]
MEWSRIGIGSSSRCPHLRRLIHINKIYKTELQILFFIFIASFRRCPLSLKLMSFVLNVSKSCTLYSLAITQIIFSVK